MTGPQERRHTPAVPPTLEGWRSIGDIEMLIISDGLLRSSATRIAGQIPPEIVGEYLLPDKQGRVWLGLNCAVIRSQDTLIVVDTGFGDGPSARDPDLRRLEPPLASALSLHGISPTDVDIVINTHLHIDHAGGNFTWDSGQARLTYPNAQYLVQGEELDWALSDEVRTGGLYQPEEVRLLIATGQLYRCKSDLQVAKGVRIRRAAGHTPGHQVVTMESRGIAATITGDLAPLLMHWRHPSFELEGDSEPKRAAVMRQEIIQWALARDANIVSYHETDKQWISIREAI